MNGRAAFRTAMVALAVALVTVLPAAAQQGKASLPNAVQGFSKNRDQPVHIEAATLEVRDKEKVAIFSGDVRVVQGDTDMRCKLLVVHYEADPKNAPANAPANAAAAARTMTASRTNVALPPAAFGGQQRIRRLEAKGGVVVKRGDQFATGRTGVFDMKSNTVTLVGDVVVSQGPNVTRGERLVVDLTSGISRIESGKAGQGRVRALIKPSSAKAPGANTPAANGKPVAEPARSAPGAPLRLN